MSANLPFENLPSHWKMERLDHIFRVIKEPARLDDPPVSAFIDGVVTLRSNRPEAIIKGSGQEIGYKHIEVNDLVISGMNAHLGGLGISDSSGKCTPVYTILRKSVDLHERYISYYLWHAAQSGYIKSLVNAVRYNSADFGPETVKRFMVPLPPIEEQRRIADYLDEQVGNLNQILDLRNNQIAVLVEESRNLTLEWIPILDPLKVLGWEDVVGKTAIKAKHLFEIRNETNVDVPLASATMDGVRLRDDLATDVWNPESSSDAYKLVQPGDFVIGLRSFQHGFSYSEVEGKVSPAYTVFRLKEDFIARMNPEYFSYLFQSSQFIGILQTIAVGIRQGKNIPFEAFANLLIPIPKKEMQTQIETVQKENLEMIAVIRSTFSLYHSLQRSLITAAVTGQFDVTTGRSVA